MYSYELINDRSKIVVRENSDVVAELDLLIKDDNAFLDMIKLSENKKSALNNTTMIMSNYFAFISVMIKDIKEELKRQSIDVKNVLFGNFSEVKELDNFANQIDEEFTKQNMAIKLANKR